MLDKPGKEKIVAQIKEDLGQALDGVVADYHGINVVAMSELRSRAKQNQVYIKVIRNTLLKRAIKDSDFACFAERLTGPTMLGFSRKELGSAAKLFKDFAKENPSFRVKGLAMQGKFMEPEQIDILASLPTYNEAMAQLARVLQAPVQKLATVMMQMPAKFVCALDAIRRKKS